MPRNTYQVQWSLTAILQQSSTNLAAILCTGILQLYEKRHQFLENLIKFNSILKSIYFRENLIFGASLPRFNTIESAYFKESTVGIWRADCLKLWKDMLDIMNSSVERIYIEILIYCYDKQIEAISKLESEQGRRKLKKSGGQEPKNTPKLTPPKQENCILLHFYIIILKIQGVSWPLWPPSHAVPESEYLVFLPKFPYIEVRLYWLS